jgi:hypothetical protein
MYGLLSLKSLLTFSAGSTGIGCWSGLGLGACGAIIFGGGGLGRDAGGYGAGLG